MLGASMENAPTRLLRGLLFVALRRAGADLTLEEAGTLLTRNIRQVSSALSKAWIASMQAAETRKSPEKGKAKPAKQLDWMEHWAMATSRYGLGLSEEQWLDLTPRQVHALQGIRIERMQREEFLNGLVAQTVANFSMSPPKKPFKVDDFMIHKFPDALIPDEPIDGEYIMEAMAAARSRATRSRGI